MQMEIFTVCILRGYRGGGSDKSLYVFVRHPAIRIYFTYLMSKRERFVKRDFNEKKNKNISPDPPSLLLSLFSLT